MDIAKAIDEIRTLLRETVSERVLLDEIPRRVEALRKEYPRQKGAFTAEHIEFLRGLTNIRNKLEEFVELREELENVEDFETHESLKTKLESIRPRLEDHAVCRRIDKELRGLDEKVPEIRRKHEERRRSRETARIRELEREAPKCSKGHLMEIKEGEFGPFWGCTKFPACFSKKQLSKAELDFLKGFTQSP